MRVYIAGPMGKWALQDYNRASFEQAWNHLTKAGVTAISPHFLESAIDIEARARMGAGALYRYAIPIDIFALSSCQAALALPGWEDSKGSCVEQVNAGLMEIPWVAPDTTLHKGPGDIGQPLALFLDVCLIELREIALASNTHCP